jgi:adenylate cyclase
MNRCAGWDDPLVQDQDKPQDGSRIGAELLEEAFLGEAAHLTREQVENTASDFSPERTRSLWRALGFVDPDPDELRFTEADVAALRLSQRLASDEMIGAGITESVARTVGQAMSRLAEAQTQIVSEQLAADPELAELAQSHPEEMVRQVSERFAHLLPELEWLIAYAWRRHMLAAVQRAVAGAARDLSSGTTVVGFCDIVGYTSAVRDMTSADLSDLVATFERVASDIVIAHDGRIVKTLGDEVMFTIVDPVQAAYTGLALSEAFGQDDAPVPAVRVGLAYGPTLAHAGDIFGPVVNLASRCTGIARPGTVVCDRELAKPLEEAIDSSEEAGFTVSRLRTFRVRGYAHLTPYVIRRRQ